MMWKFYKLQLILMSPLLAVSFIFLMPIYYLYKFADNTLIKEEQESLSFHNL